jgi:Uma2 family endonuclease
MSFAEYIAPEAKSEIRHEFLNGDVFAMAGGTPEHSVLAGATIRELGVALRGRPCHVFTSDLRVRVAATGLVTYPDVTVICADLESHPEDRSTILNPLVLVEVLSDSTEAYDRGAKAAHYRRIDSLREYVLISQNEPRIEVFRRLAGGHYRRARSYFRARSAATFTFFARPPVRHFVISAFGRSLCFAQTIP